MLTILLGFTFIAGILIHILVTQLPVFLQRSWEQECMTYFDGLNISKIQEKKLQWWHYVPFCSMRFLTLDIILLSSALFIFYHFEGYLYWASALLFTWLLITSSFIDFEHQILPDELTYTLLWLGLICSCWHMYIYSARAIFGAIFGAIFAYLSLFIISFLFKLIRKKEGIGQGDFKLFAAIGAWTGVIYLPLILFLASLSSVIFILLRKVIAKKPCSSPAPFGPFLALAGWCVLLWGSEITHFIIY
ncbi:MAG: A24 family peptidase [Pseudomonadota bacterium]